MCKFTGKLEFIDELIQKTNRNRIVSTLYLHLQLLGQSQKISYYPNISDKS